jgi:predicted nucleic acid-binding Zn ribbon protein
VKVPHSKGFERRKDVRSGDPVALGDIVDGLMAEEVFSRGMPLAELASQWPRIVGERLAEETAPVSFEAGVLTVGASNGPWGAQARFLNEAIRSRADEALSSQTVREVKIVVRPS